MTKDAVILVSVVDGIATVVLNRPAKHNALDGQMIQQLIAALQMLADNPTVRVLLLKAHGEHFCAGGDLAWMQKMAASGAADNLQDATELALLMHLLSTFPHPVMTLVQGVTVGGGVGLIAASDIAIATTNASFAFSEVKIGIVPSVISPYIIAAIGERAARYHFLMATRFSVSEAHHLGLIHQVVEPVALASVGLSVARELLQSSATALTEAKQLVARVAAQPMSASLREMTAAHLAKMRASDEAAAGLRAFLEKRTPNGS